MRLRSATMLSQQLTGVAETIEPPGFPLVSLDRHRAILRKALAESWQKPSPGEFAGDIIGPQLFHVRLSIRPSLRSRCTKAAALWLSIPRTGCFPPRHGPVGPKSPMSPLKRLVGSRPFQKIAGVMAAEYLRLVWRATRFVYEPADMYAHAETLMPVIIGMWHGQHFLASFLRRHHPGKVLISRHRDGEINAIAAEHLGSGTVRGSGAHGREHERKGGVGAFREMVDALAQGHNMALTADVPKISRVAGLGIVKLASASGRPIFLAAIATRNRITLENWDRSAVNLPFGRGAIVGAGPIYVPADADDAALESARRLVETELNKATARAYEMVDGPRRADARA